MHLWRPQLYGLSRQAVLPAGRRRAVCHHRAPDALCAASCPLCWPTPACSTLPTRCTSRCASAGWRAMPRCARDMRRSPGWRRRAKRRCCARDWPRLGRLMNREPRHPARPGRLGRCRTSASSALALDARRSGRQAGRGRRGGHDHRAASPAAGAGGGVEAGGQRAGLSADALPGGVPRSRTMSAWPLRWHSKGQARRALGGPDLSVGKIGLEPTTSTMSTWRSNQLGYLPERTLL